jgi:hypothetical protein
MPSTNIKPVIRSQASQIRPSLFCIFPSFDIFGLNKCLTTPPSVGSIHFKQSSVSWAEQALRKVTPTARHQESVLLYCVNVGLLPAKILYAPQFYKPHQKEVSRSMDEVSSHSHYQRVCQKKLLFLQFPLLVA